MFFFFFLNVPSLMSTGHSRAILMDLYVGFSCHLELDQIQWLCINSVSERESAGISMKW